MYTYFKKINTFIFLSLLFASCQKDNTWDAVLPGLPNSVSIKNSSVNSVYYILKQTHTPLLEYDEFGDFSSRVLRKFVRDKDYKSVTLCPKKNIFFNQNNQFKTKHIAEVFRRLGFKGKFSISNDCITLSSKVESIEKYLKLSTELKNSPFITEERTEYGLGKYSVSSITKNKITLRAKENSTDTFFKTINLFDISSFKNTESWQEFEDINRLLIENIDESKLKEYKNYHIEVMQSIALVFNIKNLRRREILKNCINIEKFRKAYFPGRDYFKNIKTILPIGLPNSKTGLIAQKCNHNYKFPVNLTTWNKENINSLNKYAIQLKNTTGILLNVQYMPPNEFVKNIFKVPHEYELAVISIDSTSKNIKDFFKHFYKDGELILDTQIEKLESYVISKNYNKALKVLEKSYYFIPLFQETRRFYYPNDLIGIKTGENFLEYPLIGEIKR